MKSNELKITDIRVANIDGLPKHMILLKVYTNSDIVGFGVVKNCTLNTEYIGGATLSKDCNLGGVAGAVQLNSDVKIQNITVNISANVKSLKSYILNISGIIGMTRSKLLISDCTVNGSINLQSASKWGYACGIIYGVAEGTADLTVRNCTNKASLYVRGNGSGEDVTCAAGIMGIMQDNGRVVLENCKNEGKIDSQYRAAGIIGIARKKDGFVEAFKMINCSNTGELNVVHSDNKKYNLASYGFDDSKGRYGAKMVTSVLDFSELAKNDAVYYVLTRDIDLGSQYDANALLSAFTNGVIDFCGYSVVNSQTAFNGTAANILQPSVKTTQIPLPVAYQTTDISLGDTYDIRIIASMGDYSALKELGFDISVNGNEAKKITCWEMNTKIVSEYGATPEAASVYGNMYVVCPTIEGISKSDGALTVEIIPWVITSSGKQVSGTAKAFTFTPQ